MGNAQTDSIPWSRNIVVLQRHHCGLYAIQKPAGVRSHPNTKGIDKKAILHAPYDADTQSYELADCAPHGALQKLYLLHRLDAPTSGVLLLADNQATAEAARSAFKQKQVTKNYFALVYGSPAEKSGRWRDELQKHTHQRGRCQYLRMKKGQGSLAVTDFAWLRSSAKKRIHLLQLSPLTGRTHQLRIQSALHHLPIVGDKTYGAFSQNAELRRYTGYKRLFLHAHRIELPLPTGSGMHNRDRVFFECPTPDSFDRLLREY